MKKLLLTINVSCTESISVKGRYADVNMVPFTGKASGIDFNGKTVGCGVDTQRLDKRTGKYTLSARYMLEGTDREGNKCRIFIDNSVCDESGWHPVITTDSPLLTVWEDQSLSAEVEPADGGRVTVKIYCEE